MEAWDRSWSSNPPCVILCICFSSNISISVCASESTVHLKRSWILMYHTQRGPSGSRFEWQVIPACSRHRFPLPYGCGCGSLREFTRGFGSLTLLWREWHLSRTQLDKVVLFAIRKSNNEMEATERFEILRVRIYSVVQMDWECV